MPKKLPVRLEIDADYGLNNRRQSHHFFKTVEEAKTLLL